MNITVIVAILAVIALLIGLAVTVYLYLRNKTLEDIRKDVYQLFLKAEHNFTETKQGKQKFDYVIQNARSLLPTWAQLIITEKLLRKVVQLWFEAVKDLLDDGKCNKSTRRTTKKTTTN